MTPPVREPRSISAATELLEQYATLDGQIAQIEADRNSAIAAENARADTAANDLIGRRSAIAEKLEAWWNKNAAQLTKGGRKTIELGGCIIGSRAGRASLAVAGKEKDVAKSLSKRKWAVGLFRIGVSLDRVALLKALPGLHGKKLKALGFSVKEGTETFVLERAEQAGTMAGADA